MAWCWSGRECHGKCNYFKQEGDSTFYYVETEFEEVAFLPLWPVESFIAVEGKDRDSEKVTNVKLRPLYIYKSKFKIEF